MYSVIIQNQKTNELFQEFHPLFLEAIKNDVPLSMVFATEDNLDFVSLQLNFL